MPELLDLMPPVAKKKHPRDRVDLRADPDWLARVEEYADLAGLNLSAYIRMATTKQMERDDAERDNLRHKPARS